MQNAEEMFTSTPTYDPWLKVQNPSTSPAFLPATYLDHCFQDTAVNSHFQAGLLRQLLNIQQNNIHPCG